MVYRAVALAVVTVVAAVLVVGVSTGSAETQSGVVVENTGHHELESELSLGIFFHVGAMEIPGLLCDNDSWEAQVAANGQVTVVIPDIAAHMNDIGPCDTAQPCPSDQWPGQISETGAGAFRLNLTTCVKGTGAFYDNTNIPIQCTLVNTEAHCDHRFHTGDGTVTNPHYEYSGELTLHESLGLMHAR